MYIYPRTKQERKERNKIEVIVFSFFTIGVIAFALTRCPACVLTTILSIPFCCWSPIKKFIDK